MPEPILTVHTPGAGANSSAATPGENVHQGLGGFTNLANLAPTVPSLSPAPAPAPALIDVPSEVVSAPVQTAAEPDPLHESEP